MSKRVLLADDEIHILKAAEIKLSRAGFEVVTASDGQEAWEIIQRQPPDLLVTDCQMPRLNGLQLIQCVRRHEPTRNLPILMLSAKGFELAEADLIGTWNVLAVLGKPFSPRELVRYITNVLEAGTLTRELALS